MLISFVRTGILLIVIVIAVRIMGKRQIGQLQPAELVVTILLSEIAATPMQDNDIPMLNSLVAIAVLVSLEILMSVVSLKSRKARGLLQGNSVIIIRNGKVDYREMKRLRYTLDDLLEALRQKDVFDIGDVQYAIAETNGTLSVLLKSGKRTVTTDDLGIESTDNGLSCAVIKDGEIVKSEFRDCAMNDRKLESLIKSTGEKIEDIFLLTVDKSGSYNLIKKEQGND